MERLFLTDDFFNIYSSEIYSGAFIHDKNWKKKVYDRLLLTLFLISFPAIFFFLKFLIDHNQKHLTLIEILILVPVIFSASVFYFIINPHYKSQLSKLGVPTDTIFWKYWYDNIEYHRFKIIKTKSIFKEIYDIDIDSLNNHELENLISLFNKKAEIIKPDSLFKLQSLALFLPALLSFMIVLIIDALVPDKLLVGNLLPNIIAANKLTNLIIIFLIVFGFWYFISLVHWEIRKRKNRNNQVYEEISKNFEEIRMNRMFTKDND